MQIDHSLISIIQSSSNPTVGLLKQQPYITKTVQIKFCKAGGKSFEGNARFQTMYQSKCKYRGWRDVTCKHFNRYLAK